MRLDALWKTLTLDEREDLAARSGLRLGYLRLLGAGHKTGCSLATVLALIRVERRLTADELVEEFSAPVRDSRLPPKKARGEKASIYDVPAGPMTHEEERDGIAKLRQSGQALLQHADALEAWNASRPARPVYAEAPDAAVIGEA